MQFEVEGNIAEAGNTNNQGSGLLFGFLAAAIVLFLVFGSLVAMLLPLITAGVSLGAGTAVVGLLSHAINIATFSTELALLIGLGVGVDYALFIVTRYKQALARGESREASVVEAIDTSGRAVLFAGLIVCIAMLGHVRPGRELPVRRGHRGRRDRGVHRPGGADAAAGAAGHPHRPLVPRRRERRALKEGKLQLNVESPAWVRWTDAMSKRPAVFAAVAALVMIIIADPVLLACGWARPTPAPTRRAPPRARPTTCWPRASAPATTGRSSSWPRSTARLGSGGVRQGRARGGRHARASSARPLSRMIGGRQGRPTVAIASVYPKGSPQAASTTDLLSHVRNHGDPGGDARAPALTVLVGGTTAIFEDFSHILSAKLPLFIGVVVVLSFLLLMAVFRSIVIPLTAAVMNLLSAGAAFGIVTAIFQKGWLGGTTGPIETFVPVLMFPILFGLSMDYEVFLVSRIYEEWHRRRDNTEAVAHGLAATGRTITAAAAIMVLVFASFILGGERIIELFGVGLASAVLLDALIVRSVLVPALMILLGDSNWKIPSWLNSALPRLNVEGSASARTRGARARARGR